jgi:hypothetical protein
MNKRRWNMRATNPSRPSKQTAERLAAESYKARFRDERAKLQRAYCTLFAFWRACRFKPCRCARACKGDAAACIKRGVGAVARDAQWQARQRILEATPAGAGAPERAARQCLPGELC